MGSSVVAKFFCSSVEVYHATCRKVVFKPVYSEDANHENKKFWDATPAGEITMTITNPNAFEQFEPGKEYYVTFAKA